jgi:hypothetical protein
MSIQRSDFLFLAAPTAWFFGTCAIDLAVSNEAFSRGN